MDLSLIEITYRTQSFPCFCVLIPTYAPLRHLQRAACNKASCVRTCSVGIQSTELHPAVEVGDVGFIREGRFHRLFNALLLADHPSHNLGVPGYREPLIPSLSAHIITATLSPSHYCSAGIDV